MAKRQPTSPGAADRTNDDHRTPATSGVTARDLAVPAFTSLREHVEHQSKGVRDYGNDLSLDDVTNLMKQVQVSQRNLTEALNALSAYRKEVARVLETKRRESANERRKAQGPAKEQTVTPPFDDIE